MIKLIPIFLVGFRAALKSQREGLDKVPNQVSDINQHQSI